MRPCTCRIFSSFQELKRACAKATSCPKLPLSLHLNSSFCVFGREE